MENIDYDCLFDENIQRRIDECAERYCHWRQQGKTLNELTEYQKMVDRHIWLWGRSIYSEMTKEHCLDLAEALVKWKNTAIKSDENWIRIFGRIFFDDVLQTRSWPTKRTN